MTTQTKALNEYFLMALLTLLLSRVHVFAIFKCCAVDQITQLEVCHPMIVVLLISCCPWIIVRLLKFFFSLQNSLLHYNAQAHASIDFLSEYSRISRRCHPWNAWLILLGILLCNFKFSVKQQGKQKHKLVSQGMQTVIYKEIQYPLEI